MNSREKGKRGERLWRDELREQGYAARRGQQFSGSPDSPDVICEALPGFHFEVKAVERLNIEDAMAQARRDAGAKVPFVAHKRNFCGWLVTMDADAFFRLLRGDFVEPQRRRDADIGIDTSPFVPLPVRGGEGNVPGESPSTAPESGALPTNQNNKPNKGT